MSFDFRSVLKRENSLPIFNPSKEKLERDFGGNTYVFPPEGVKEITDVTHYKHNRAGELEPYHIAAEVVAAHFVGEDGRSGSLGTLGCRVLSKDDAINDEIKAEAYKVCKERQYINDVNARTAHLQACKIARDSGQPAPSASRQMMEVYARIEQYETESGTKAPFRCDPCAIPFFSSDALSRHNDAHHQGTTPVASSSSSEVETLKATVAALLAQNAQILEALKTQPAKKVGRPRKEATA